MSEDSKIVEKFEEKNNEGSLLDESNIKEQ